MLELYNKDFLEGAWSRYKKAKTKEKQDEIILETIKHLRPLIQHFALENIPKAIRTAHYQYCVEDILSAFKQYKPQKTSFATYIYGIIRYSTLNFIRVRPDITTFDRAINRERRFFMNLPIQPGLTGKYLKNLAGMEYTTLFSDLTDKHDPITTLYKKHNKSQYDEVDDKEMVQKLLQYVNGRELEAINAHIYDNQTFEEIGKKWGVNRKRAHQIYKSGIERIRTKLTELGKNL